MRRGLFLLPLLLAACSDTEQPNRTTPNGGSSGSAGASTAGSSSGGSSGESGSGGQSGSGGTPVDVMAEKCKQGRPIKPGSSPIRRLNRFEYNNTVRDLLGDDSNPAAEFNKDEEALGFENNASALTVSSATAEKYMLVAEGISDRATNPITKNVTCDPSVVGETECANEFIESFGRRAFRRPLQDDERIMFQGLYEAGRQAGDFREGIRFVIEAALQAPPFLYRVEFGQAPSASEEYVLLNSFEMASRLSYLFWGSMPDATLFTAAEADELKTKEQIKIQAERMVQDPKARAMVKDFHRQWLDYDRVLGVGGGKDAKLFPDWKSKYGPMMLEETNTFVEHVVFDSDHPTYAELMSAPYTFVNDELSVFYGLDPQVFDMYRKVYPPEGHTVGLLTQGSLMTYYAHSDQTSPTHRGKWVREQLVCGVVSPPPPGADTTPPKVNPDSTARERFEQHTKDETCRACHVLMDPIGFGFENLDAIGRYRTQENGIPIDASGDLTVSDKDGEFDGVVELSNLLVNGQDGPDCYASQWFRYGNGRGEESDDSCTMYELKKSFREGSLDIKTLIISLTQTDAFLYKKVQTP